METALPTNVLARGRLVPSVTFVPIFSATLFLSAGLMFLVEPMVAKMVLPRLGGSPAVWSTCMVFFQAMLLLGYGYAHVATRVFSPLTQIALHLGVVLPVAALSLPLNLGSGVPSAAGSPVLWLLTRLLLNAGPAVFAIAATAPLLQSWFAKLDHKAAGDPYFLYAASNAGSLLALLAYPLLVEPVLPLDRQALFWSWSFGSLALGIVACAATAMGWAQLEVRGVAKPVTPPSTAYTRLAWTALAFVPSSLLLGVTTKITTDVTSAPLLWVVPLMLYLTTFILTFAQRRWPPHALMVRLMPLILIPIVIQSSCHMILPIVPQLALDLGCFFVVAMVCHGELARRRPPGSQLTEFYLFLSVGGVLGGTFNALLAPLIFPGVWEYPLVLVAACALKPEVANDKRPESAVWNILLPVGLVATLVVSERLLQHLQTAESWGVPRVVMVAMICVPFIAVSMVLLNASLRRWRFTLCVAACLLAATVSDVGGTITSARSFFGVYRLSNVVDASGDYLVLMNGTTMHGVRGLLPGEERQPMAYYSRQGPFGHFFAALPVGSVRHVAVIGLGTGVLGCYAQPGQDWTFYEIDPLVERFARDPRYFQFLSHCGNTPRVVLGDARMTVANAADATYDVLIVDAFSSDSIPMHLLTREALALYLRKLAPGGHILFHISSRTLDLAPVIAALTEDAGVPAELLSDQPPIGTSIWRRSPAFVAIVAGSGGNLDGLDTIAGRRELPLPYSGALWTDQRSDILRAIRRGF